MATITTKRITAVPAGGSTSRVSGAITANKTARVSSTAVTAGNTARVNVASVQSTAAYNTWGASWGVVSSWLVSWRVARSLSGMGHTARISAIPSGGQTQRVTGI